MAKSSARTVAYVGNYTRHQPYPRGKADGVNVYGLDPTSGAMTLIQTAPGTLNPTFLALDPAQRHLYAVSAVPDIDGHDGGALSAYTVDPATGQLAYLNRESVLGNGPCHVAIDASAAYAITANYHGGNFTVLPIRADGSLGPATDFIQHSGGSGVVLPNQGQAHAHSATIDAANRFVLVCDLGMDKVMVYRLNLISGKLSPNSPPFVQSHPGAGPRHLCFHPDKRHAYVINELNGTMTAYAYYAAGGVLRELQTVPTVPAGYTGFNAGAEVRVAPSGRFVYASNRGHDSIVIYAIEEKTGLLTYVGHEPSQGKVPRNFTISADGSLMLVANQDSDTIVAFHVDKKTGKLTPTGQVTASPSPTCIKIVTLPGQ